mmetsp:Transcript_22696/g.17120  ORF Transcript_22696/g.17120 Transcript_22696/m.17120 type:complete len:86 (-) Transcript_22696:97-354(-)
MWTMLRLYLPEWVRVVAVNTCARFLLSYMLSGYFLYLYDSEVKMKSAFYYIPDIAVISLVLFFAITDIPRKVERRFGTKEKIQQV